MTIIEHPQADFFGGKLDYITFTPNVKSSKVLVFAPGTVEMGIGDGLQLSELYKFGYPKLAKAGYEFPFNIVAIQPSKSYSGVSKSLLPWIDMEFKPSAIIGIGISLGAIHWCDMLGKDNYKLLKAIVSLSGKGNPLSVDQMVSVKGWAFHGDKDTTVSYGAAMAFYKAYNDYQKAHGLPGEFAIEVIPGLGHSGWDNAMSVIPGKDQILQFIINQFGPEPTEGLTYEDGYLAAKTKILNSIQGI